MMSNFHPGLILILGGILAGILPGRLRQASMVGAPLLALYAMFTLKVGTLWTIPFINGLELQILKVDELSWVFGLIFSIMALLGNIYALHNENKGEALAGLAYAGSSLGVVFSGDWMTLIFFWELMAVSSVFLIWYRGNAQSRGAGFRYLLVHMFGGNLLLAGIFLKITAGQPLITALTGTNDAAFWLILLGVGVNAAIPPLHAWLTDAYPEGTITGSVFLSSFTTKVAVYCLIRIFPGATVLLWAGVIMALYGVVYAVLENNIRRLLAYHIISQVGFMVAGVGIGSQLALNGATSHAYSHILYKSLLFMSAGAVIQATGVSKLTELGGLARKMPLVFILYTIGAFSISGVPLFNGFISKSMIISAAAYEKLPIAELLLYLASIGTFLSIALKLKFFMFFGTDRQLEPKPIPKNMYVAMGGGALLCTLYGIVPSLLYTYLPFDATYVPFTLDHVISSVQLMVAALIAFWIFIPKMEPKIKISVDTDWFYRRPLIAVVKGLVWVVCTARETLASNGMYILKQILPFFNNPLKWAPQTVQDEVVGDYSEDKYRFPVGTTVLMSLLVFVVTISYIWFL
ncbi:MAG: Na(+)/H(+) antiporter subunit D [Bacillota bacterium]